MLIMDLLALLLHDMLEVSNSLHVLSGLRPAVATLDVPPSCAVLKSFLVIGGHLFRSVRSVHYKRHAHTADSVNHASHFDDFFFGLFFGRI